jgi:pentatricopeptide repeat protein
VAEEAERHQDDADEPCEPPLVRLAEVVGHNEEARELRDWLSEAPKRERKKTKRPKSDLHDLEEELERSKLAKSVFVKPARTYPNKRESRRSSRTHHQSISTQVYFDRNVQNLLREGIPVSPYSTDWRHVLSFLEFKTPEESDQWIEDGMKIELPEHKFEAIMENGGDEKIGAIRRRTGASIKVSRADGPTAPSTLLVSGTRAAINSTIAEFRRIAGRITITRLWAELRPGEARTESFSEDDFFVPPLTREEGGPWRRSKVDYNAYTTPWPAQISFGSFERYVASLTDSVVLPHLNSVLYNPTKHAVLLDHERAVARRLKRAFANYEAKPWISCAALKLALAFLCRSGDRYLPEARSIFNSMDRFGLRMDADVFNMMLKAPTTTRDLRKFRQTVVSMTRKGFAPTLDTWILFLRMFESVEVKSYVLQAMNSKNLLSSPEAIRRVAEEMAPFDAEHAMSQGKDLSTFLQEQDDRYGPDWLTRDAANPVLDVLCRHGRFHNAFELLDRMRAYVGSIPGEYEADRVPYQPDVISFNTIITHAKVQGKIPVAVNAVRKMRTAAFATQPDRYTFALLFELAWKSRLRSTVSVVWRYASLARLTTWRMRKRVVGLLRGEPSGGRRETVHDTPTSTHTQLGGEGLARDLVGGGRALARIRSLAEGRSAAELGALAAKCWPEAFRDFGPMVSLGHVLSQSVLRDLACLAAKKKKKKEGSGSGIPPEAAKLNVMPVRRRSPKKQFGLGDLAPLEDEGPTPIGASDKWVLDAMLGYGKKKLGVLRLPSAAEGDQTPAAAADSAGDHPGEETGPHEKETKTSAKSARRARIAILDPEVWADIRGGDESTTATPIRHELQISNEDDILAALGRLELEYFSSFRKVVCVDDEGEYGFGWSAVDRARDGLDGLDGDDGSDWRSIVSAEDLGGGDAEGGGGDGEGSGDGADREKPKDDGGTMDVGSETRV